MIQNSKYTLSMRVLKAYVKVFLPDSSSVEKAVERSRTGAIVVTTNNMLFHKWFLATEE